MYEGTEREIVIQESVFSRHGADRVLRYAFELADSRAAQGDHGRHQEQRHRHQHAVVGRARRSDRPRLPGREVDKQHIDILSARFVLQPSRFDVVVASNLFGDILSDLGPATTGTIGLAPSANLNPERKFPSLFEPVHGSAPDIAGRNIANPIAMIWSGALMLDFLTRARARAARRTTRSSRRSRHVLIEGPRTRRSRRQRLDHRGRASHRGARRRCVSRPTCTETDMPLTIGRSDLLPGRNLIGATGAMPPTAAASTSPTRPPTASSPTCPTAVPPTRAPRSMPRTPPSPPGAPCRPSSAAQILKRWNDLIARAPGGPRPPDLARAGQAAGRRRAARSPMPRAMSSGSPKRPRAPTAT